MPTAQYWRFIETYLPNYYSRDDVLLSDILCRYIEHEDISLEDKQRIEATYKDRKSLIEDYIHLEKELFGEALENYYTTYHNPTHQSNCL